MTVGVPARPAALSRAGLRRVLVTLCVTEITSWGVLYYAFPVLAPTMTATTGWSTTGVVGAFSVGQLMSAVAGIAVGRRLDREGPRRLMTAGWSRWSLSLLRRLSRGSGSRGCWRARR